MKMLLSLLILGGIAVGPAWGQDAMDADSIARAKALLRSASWSDKAWGAFVPGLPHDHQAIGGDGRRHAFRACGESQGLPAAGGRVPGGQEGGPVGVGTLA